MNGVLIATIAGLLTAFCWGTSDYLSARSTRKLNPFQINFTVQVSSLLLVAIFFAVSGLHLHMASEFIRIVISSLVLSTGYIIFVQALSGGVVGIIVPLGNIYPLFTILLAIAFLHVHFTLLQMFALLAIVLGAMVLAYEKNHKKIPLRELHRKTFLALIAAVVWGIGFFIVSPVTQTVSWQSIAVVSEGTALVLSVALLLWAARGQVQQQFQQSLTASSWPWVIGIFGEVGLVSLYIGSAHAHSVVIPAVLSACGPLVASVWGAIFDHERLGYLKRMGAIITIAGIIILNVG